MPYSSLSKEAFWKNCRDTESFASDLIYHPKFQFTPDTAIATAGSCFAQNIGRYLRRSSATFLDAEPAPHGLSKTNAARFGYGLYSGRYGNIYTAKQLMQLTEEVLQQETRTDIVWTKEDRFYDALRPNIEPKGLGAPEEVLGQRADHIRRLYRLFKKTDIFIFTLGLTECWQSSETGLVYPSCPGVIAGQYDQKQYQFHNARYTEIYDDLMNAFAHLKLLNPDMKFLLTVSPVPLTASASGEHVLSATTYSKSVLRAVAGDLANDETDVDYFPSYELITGAPFSGQFFEDNLRQVTDAGVDFAMSVFFGAHPSLECQTGTEKPTQPQSHPQGNEELEDRDVCEEVLLDSFRE